MEIAEDIRVGRSDCFGDGDGTDRLRSGGAVPEEQKWRVCSRTAKGSRLVQPPAFSIAGKSQQ